MSSAPSLSGTIYTDNDLQKAREVWADVERRYMPGWFTKPTGLVAKLFQADTQYVACLLIDIAAALYILSRNYTEKSKPVFEAKMKFLLTVADEKMFDELLTEIFVAANLAPAVSPMAFEPYVPRDRKGRIIRFLRNIMKTNGQQPPSPDYAILLPDGVVAVEVTMLYIEQLEKWQRRVNAIRDLLSKKIGAEEGIYRDVDLELPLDFDPKLGNQLCERRITNDVMRRERGEVQLSVGQDIARLRWRPMPIYERSTFDVRDVPAEVNSWIITAPRAAAKNGFGFKSRPTGNPQQIAKLMFRSLKNTLERKRDQFRGKNDRYVLVLKLGHHRMPSGLLHDLFRSRIWPNSAYDWLTCFGEFQPRRHYMKGSPGSSLTFQINPNGSPSAGPLLTALLDSKKMFHTDKGIIKASLRHEPASQAVLHHSPVSGFRGKLFRASSMFPSRTIT